MKTFYFGFFGVFALVYLVYITWLTGYRAGYDEGNTEAWITARKALAPHLSDAEEFTLGAGDSPNRFAVQNREGL